MCFRRIHSKRRGDAGGSKKEKKGEKEKRREGEATEKKEGKKGLAPFACFSFSKSDRFIASGLFAVLRLSIQKSV